MASELESKDISDLWHLVGRTIPPLVVRNKVRIISNLVIIFLVSFLPFVFLPFTLSNAVEKGPALYTTQLFLPGLELDYLILSINIMCCLIVILGTAIEGILEYRLSPLYAVFSFLGSLFLIVALTYNVLPLFFYGKTRPITWQVRKYIYKKEQEGFSL